MVKTHDRDYFHKYLKAEDAIAILDSLKVQWSAPHTFNDPFDLQIDMRFPFSSQQLVDAMGQEVENAIFSTDVPEGTDSRLLPIINDFRKDSDTLPRRHFGPWLRKHYGQRLSALEQKQLNDANAMWRDWRADKMLFCVAEEPDNLLMWAHYADSHKGAVLKLKCLPERGTALCNAKPVRYRDELPSLGGLEAWARCIVGLGPTPLSDIILRDYVLTKSEHWKYEKEWRTITRVDHEDRPGYALLNINPEEIDTIYLGCKMSAERKNEVARRLTGHLQHVNLYQACRSDVRFAIEFKLLRRGGRS